MMFTENVTDAVIRNDQNSPRDLSIALVAKHHITPPTPLPEDERVLAKLLLVMNH